MIFINKTFFHPSTYVHVEDFSIRREKLVKLRKNFTTSSREARRSWTKPKGQRLGEVHRPLSLGQRLPSLPLMMAGPMYLGLHLVLTQRQQQQFQITDNLRLSQSLINYLKIPQIKK